MQEEKRLSFTVTCEGKTLICANVGGLVATVQLGISVTEVIDTGDRDEEGRPHLNIKAILSVEHYLPPPREQQPEQPSAEAHDSLPSTDGARLAR